ncbi:hypothetical protein [Alteromonas gilva]|uniref:Uncharacterized protein n=1 Tax=Alteromonas gilva TaxID=2987522 RepID=A0ABT5KYF6_9ALTE|nr:hypothetical protein [Alteromonas gilva]MDC8829286.1 hypothetical protein [Alteromonas gilva]
MRHCLINVAGLLTLLSGCGVTQPEPFDAAKSPEERREYNGLKGLVQQQKDQNYLMAAALQQQCDAARVDLAVAQSTGDATAAAAQRKIMANTCL